MSRLTFEEFCVIQYQEIKEEADKFEGLLPVKNFNDWKFEHFEKLDRFYQDYLNETIGMDDGKPN